MINIIKITNKPKLNFQKLSATVILAFLLVAAFAFLVPKIETVRAEALTFGKTIAGGNFDSVGSNVIFGSKFTAPANGTITKVSAYVYGLQAGQVQALIYSDSGGIPNTLLVSSSTQGIIEAPSWRDFDLNLAVTQGSVYWLCLLSGSSGGPYFYYFDPGAINQLVTGTFGPQNNLQNPAFSSNTMSIYATYATSSAASPTPSPLSTPTPTPVTTPTPVSTPTPTSTPTPSASATSNSAPTSTPTVTSTPTPTSIATTAPTQTPSASPIESSTPTPSIPEFPISYILAGIAVLGAVSVLATLIIFRHKK